MVGMGCCVRSESGFVRPTSQFHSAAKSPHYPPTPHPLRRAAYPAGRHMRILSSIRISVRSTRPMPSSLSKSSAGARSSKTASGVDSQCAAFSSSPNMATACAITRTKPATTISDGTILFYGESPSVCRIPERVGFAAADYQADQPGGGHAQQHQQKQARAQRQEFGEESDGRRSHQEAQIPEAAHRGDAGAFADLWD